LPTREVLVINHDSELVYSLPTKEEGGVYGKVGEAEILGYKTSKDF
jgi:hypothetical protein